MASIQVSDSTGKVCHASDVPIVTPLATLDTKFSIEYNPKDVDFYVAGKPIHKYASNQT
jgi:hypothetical protein